MPTSKKQTLGSALVIKTTTKNEGVLKLVDKALRGAATIVQSMRESAKDFDAAAKACAEHAKLHGYVMPAHRLVMGLREYNHGATDTLSNELVAWFRAHSSIRWDAKKAPYQVKEGEPGYKPYEADYAETESFEDMDQVKRARQAAGAASANTLREADAKALLGRIYGLRSWFKRIEEGKDQRTVLKDGERAAMVRILNAVEEAAAEATPKRVQKEMEGAAKAA